MRREEPTSNWDDAHRQREPAIMRGGPRPPSSVQCGLPLILLWGLQGLIDEGHMTAAEAMQILLGASGGETDG